MPDFILDEAQSGNVSIKVIGVGGGGCNAVDSVYHRGLANVDFCVINSDLQALRRTKCPNRIQIGLEQTRGRGCGADPKLGEQCMSDARETMVEMLQNTELVFITSGLGGGTGTGAAPVLAQIARELGILTVGVVTTPFKFEGNRRMKTAVEGIERLREHCDTLIIVNNNRLLDVVGPRVPLKEAFGVADHVLADAVQAISDLIATPCLVNLDFNDVRAIMGGRGGAVMGIGVGKGENRAQEAVKKATSSPLLDKLVIDGATGILVCITGGPDMTLSEVDEAVSLITEMADPDVDIIFGAGEDSTLADQMRVTLIATGFREDMLAKREAEENRKAQLRGDRNGSRNSNAPRIPALPKAEVNIPLFDEIDAPKAQEPEKPYVPAAPVAQAQNPGGARAQSLRDTLLSMKSEQENMDPIPAGYVRANAAPAASAIPAEPPIRVAGGGSMKAPSSAYNVRPANRPSSAAVPVGRPTARPLGQQPAPQAQAAQEPATVAIFDPEKSPEGENKSGINFEIPSFMRRKGGLFE